MGRSERSERDSLPPSVRRTCQVEPRHRRRALRGDGAPPLGGTPANKRFARPGPITAAAVLWCPTS